MKLRSGYLSLLIFSSAICAGTVAADSESVVAELKSCARMPEEHARLSCYETLGRRVLGGELSSTSPAKTTSSSTEDPGSGAGVATAATASAALSPSTVPASEPKMDDNMGGYQFADKPSDHPDNDIHTRVTQCQQDIDKVWFFKFENGQVWKQVDRARLYFKDCDLGVVVSKDGFGYKMQLEGEGRKIRISRRK